MPSIPTAGGLDVRVTALPAVRVVSVYSPRVYNLEPEAARELSQALKSAAALAEKLPQFKVGDIVIRTRSNLTGEAGRVGFVTGKVSDTLFAIECADTGMATNWFSANFKKIGVRDA